MCYIKCIKKLHQKKKKNLYQNLCLHFPFKYKMDVYPYSTCSDPLKTTWDETTILTSFLFVKAISRRTLFLKRQHTDSIYTETSFFLPREEILKVYINQNSCRIIRIPVFIIHTFFVFICFIFIK